MQLFSWFRSFEFHRLLKVAQTTNLPLPKKFVFVKIGFLPGMVTKVDLVTAASVVLFCVLSITVVSKTGFQCYIL